ncbi:tastin isoform X2 [Ambystoma mexicanum]|uniref:tastin isoform X2 n=1 Tax=Ambystoma mexicanum TaxID=8296 RepID=UPI0037E794EA
MKMLHQRPAAQSLEEANHRPACLGKENNPNLNCEPDFSRSKIPVKTKSRPVPDFKKLHNSWEAKFHQGKAVSKKACTRPCPFSLTEKGGRIQILPAEDLVNNYSWDGCTEDLTTKPPPTARHQASGAEPLEEMHPGQRHASNINSVKELASANGPSGRDFKADPKSLASIVANVGLSDVLDPGGKCSLPLRVPVHGTGVSALHAGTRVPVGRMSAYAAPTQRHHAAAGPMPRPSILAEQGPAGWGFKADHKALATIVDNVGLSDALGSGGKCSLHMRVPVQENRASAIPSGAHVPVGRMSAYAVPTQRQRTAAGPMPRPSILAEQGAGKRSLLGDVQRSHLPSSLLESEISQKVQSNLVKPQCQMNTVLQAREDCLIGDQPKKATDSAKLPSPAKPVGMPIGALSAADGAPPEKPVAVLDPIMPGPDCKPFRDADKDANNGSPDFVTDPLALASILSNTGLITTTFGNGGKLSMAKRVPVRGKGVASMYAVANSGVVGTGSVYGPRASFAPRVDSGRASCIPSLGILDTEMGRTPNQTPHHGAVLLPDAVVPSPFGSARRVPDRNPLASYLRSLPKRSRPVFPKTPQARAMEAARKQLNTEAMLAGHLQAVTEASNVEPPKSSSRVTWSNGLSPQSASQDLLGTPDDEAAVPLKVAVRLFPETDSSSTCHDADENYGTNKTLILKDMAQLRHIEQLSKQLQQEMADCALRLFPDLPISKYQSVMTNPTAHLQDLPAVTYKVSKNENFSGMEDQPPLSGVHGASSSEPKLPFTGRVFDHTLWTGMFSPKPVAFPDVSSVQQQTMHPGAAMFEQQTFSDVSGMRNLENHPLLGISGIPNAEHEHTPGSLTSERWPILVPINAEKQLLPVSSSAEHEPLLTSSSNELQHRSGSSSAEHRPLPEPSTAKELQPLNSSFGEQISYTSGVSLQGAPAAQPTAPRSTLKQMFQRMLTTFEEACLDDECRFYTSKPSGPCPDAALRSETSCRNPLATMLEQKEAMHFSPIKSPKT